MMGAAHHAGASVSRRAPVHVVVVVVVVVDGAMELTLATGSPWVCGQVLAEGDTSGRCCCPVPEAVRTGFGPG